MTEPSQRESALNLQCISRNLSFEASSVSVLLILIFNQTEKQRARLRINKKRIRDERYKPNSYTMHVLWGLKNKYRINRFYTRWARKPF